MSLSPRVRALGSVAAIVASVAFVLVGFRVQAGVASEMFPVVIAGSGPGGIAAAIQVAASGEKVALVESTDWIGGQMTAAGAGTMDEGNTRARVSGVYADFVARVRAFYKAHDKSINTCYHRYDSICVDPAVGQQILKDMLGAHPSISVFLRTSVAEVIKRGTTVTGVVLSSGKRLDTTMLVDATEQGDVLALAGAGYRIGTGTSADPPPSSACIRDITYTAVIKRYPKGVPPELTFTAPPPGYTEAIRKGFGAFVQQNGFNLPRSHRLPLNFAGHNAYRGLPDLANPKNYNSVDHAGADITRTVVNLANDAPATVGSVEDPAIRTRTTCDAKLRTLQFVYYLQHDLGERDWSIADDEGYDTAFNTDDNPCPRLRGFEVFEQHLPVAPYTRESRRVIGVSTLTGADIRRDKAKGGVVARSFADSIAVGYFPIDVGHHCATAADLEPGLDTLADYTGAGSQRPFEVPLGVLIPARVDGLLVAEKNVSASRIAATALREQPIAFAIGQAAGALAAVAVKDDVSARQAPPNRVRDVLRRAHAVVDAPYR